MSSISDIYDLKDLDGKRHTFSKMIAFTVTIGTFFLLAVGAIDRSEEAAVLAALIAAAFALDGGKAYLKSSGNSKNAGGNVA